MDKKVIMTILLSVSIIILPAVILPELSSKAISDEIYHWVDKNGVKHFGNTDLPADNTGDVEVRGEIRRDQEKEENYKTLHEVPDIHQDNQQGTRPNIQQNIQQDQDVMQEIQQEKREMQELKADIQREREALKKESQSQPAESGTINNNITINSDKYYPVYIPVPATGYNNRRNNNRNNHFRHNNYRNDDYRNKDDRNKDYRYKRSSENFLTDRPSRFSQPKGSEKPKDYYKQLFYEEQERLTKKKR